MDYVILMMTDLQTQSIMTSQTKWFVSIRLNIIITGRALQLKSSGATDWPWKRRRKLEVEGTNGQTLCVGETFITGSTKV
jgi:hypothetical protein